MKQIVKSKIFIRMIMIELIVMMFVCIGFIKPRNVYVIGPTVNFDPDAYKNASIKYVENASVDALADEKITSDAVIDDISLTPGTYRIKLLYSTDTDMTNFVSVSDDTVGVHMLESSGENMYSGLSNTDFTLWLFESTDDLKITVSYGGTGYCRVDGLQIEETRGFYGIILFSVIVLSFLIDGIFAYAQYDRFYTIPIKKKGIHFGLLLILLFTALPLLQEGISGGGDTTYHLLRIMGIKDGLSAGQFPVRIAPEWLTGYGYADPIFYGPTLLYIGAFFRLIGFSYAATWHLFLFTINLITLLISYYSFKRIFKNDYIGLLCALLYEMSVYRVAAEYITGRLGEVMAMVFLPLILLGFYEVFSRDVKEKSYKRTWIPLTIGFAGLVQTHLLTGEMVGFATIILCIIFIKKVFRKETFVVLLKTVIYTCLVSLWFLVPFADYMLNGNFNISNASARTIQYRGLLVADLIFTFFRGGAQSFHATEGMLDSEPMGFGLALVSTFVIWCLMRFLGRFKYLSKSDLKFGKVSAWIMLSFSVMTLSVFPWDRIQQLNKLTRVLVSSIQFPKRFLSIATVAGIVLVGLVAKEFALAACDSRENAYIYKGFYAWILLGVMCSSIFLVNDIVYNVETYIIYDEKGMGTGYVAGGEYLPYGADSSKYMPHEPYASAGAYVLLYDRDGLKTEILCENVSGEEGLIELPVLYYKGYKAFDEDGGEYEITYTDNYALCVKIPEGAGVYHIYVDFYSPWYWRVAEIVSLISFAGLVTVSIIRKRREHSNEDLKEI